MMQYTSVIEEGDGFVLMTNSSLFNDQARGIKVGLSELYFPVSVQLLPLRLVLEPHGGLGGQRRNSE